MFGIRRRDFVALLGSAAVAWPLAARGQQREKLPTIGFLGAASWLDAFVARLRELGCLRRLSPTSEWSFFCAAKFEARRRSARCG